MYSRSNFVCMCICRSVCIVCVYTVCNVHVYILYVLCVYVGLLNCREKVEMELARSAQQLELSSSEIDRLVLHQKQSEKQTK